MMTRRSICAVFSINSTANTLFCPEHLSQLLLCHHVVGRCISPCKLLPLCIGTAYTVYAVPKQYNAPRLRALRAKVDTQKCVPSSACITPQNTAVAHTAIQHATPYSQSPPHLYSDFSRSVDAACNDISPRSLTGRTHCGRPHRLGARRVPKWRYCFEPNSLPPGVWHQV